jgi:hypothetical protein
VKLISLENVTFVIATQYADETRNCTMVRVLSGISYVQDSCLKSVRNYNYDTFVLSEQRGNIIVMNMFQFLCEYERNF